MIEKKSWEEFRTTGLLWFINTILHLFGYAICCEVEKGKVIDVYPARVNFRGFSETHNTKGYQEVSEYLKNNIKTLTKESYE